MSGIIVAGCVVEIDRSGGHGHSWRGATDVDCPPSIQDEIAAEIIDGERDECERYRASNGQWYRWAE